MTDLENVWDKITPGKHQIAVEWLGQASFLIKGGGGDILALDLYLTNSCERICGFKRLSPYIVRPENVKPDLLLASHNHPDHLDADAVPIIMENPGIKFAGPKSAVEECAGWGVNRRKLTLLEEGAELRTGGITVKAVFADHGDLAPDAVGFLIEMSHVRIYFAGDTAYRPDKIRETVEFKPDLIIPPINGAFGNLDSEEAARLAADVGARFALPCHFWTFREHGGNPLEFEKQVKALAPGCTPVFLRPGESQLFDARDGSF